MKKVLRSTLLVLPMVALMLLVFVSLREPSLSRTWDEDVSVLEQLGFKASDYSLHIARDFLESHELR